MAFDKKHISFAMLALLILAAAGYYIRQDLKFENGGRVINPSPPPTASTPTAPTPTPPPDSIKKPVPDLPFPVEIKANMSEEAKKMALDKIQELILRLKENPGMENYWIELGLQRKLIGDFYGAGEAWEYAAYIRPGDFIPRSNLGDLYAYSLNDANKAEANFLAAINLEPTAIMVYQKLYELYRFNMKNDVKAKAILQEGITKNPSTSERLEVILDDWLNGR